MKRTYSLGNRLLALVVTLALMLTFLPHVALTANAAITEGDMVQGSKKVDPYTIHNWKQYFGEDKMTTEYTGGVWSDKSVFNSFADYLTAEGVQNFVGPNGTAISNSVKEMLATDPANFLIAMSAITAKRSLIGSASTPMDTMLVLDVSGSMQGNNAIAVVEATNRAIDTLLSQNVNNRIGVVLYSGNHEVGNSNTGTASLLLPLGRYTTTNTTMVGGQRIPAYLTISGSGNSQTVRVANSVNNGSGADSKVVRGGTYIQNGLYQAWQQFNAVTDVKVPAGQPQAGAQRMPVVVLMSDGAPTAATTSYNNVQTSHLGDGQSSNTTSFMGFVTQLTGSWIRGKLNTKYGTTSKFYTLGVSTGNDNIATSVLNPANSNSTINGYWNTFNNASVGANVRINNRNVYKDSAVVGKNYVDQYWLANNADGLLKAFQTIVNTIVLESQQHSTLVDQEMGADLSGFITFEDELGEFMEVKNIKGMVMGNKVFTGAELAKSLNTGALGTIANPSAYGDEFVRTVKNRLGITETTVAQQLIDKAYNAGQLHYNSETDFSNYIGWYADADGKYLGFWQESDGYGMENAPANAKYINKSYGYLGAESSEEDAADMMHIVVMVHTEIATGHQNVIYKIPASLIPAVVYEVELKDNNLKDVKSMDRIAANPIRLLLEVGLRSDLNTINLETKINEILANDSHHHVHKNNDGTYQFYTNRWGSGDGNHEVDYDEPLSHLVTEAHFYPALENDRYYHVSDDLVYTDQNGTVYNGSNAPSGSGYFYIRPYYEVVNGAVKYSEKYAPINSTVITQAKKGNDGWYIPEGTPHSLDRFALTKTENTTDTLNYSWNPVILHDEKGYNSYTFLGNNGTFKMAPAQGISLTKTVAEEAAGASDTFTFHITLSQAVANPTITDADGNALTNVATVSGNVITVKIKKDQTIVITGLPTGVTYTVEEVSDGYYTPTITGATGTVSANTITKVEVENVPKIYNDLIVSKSVTHPFVNVPDGLTAQAFTVMVDLDGEDVANESFAVAGLPGITSVYTDADGKFSVHIQDGGSFTVKKLPAGTTYTVTEINLPAGYELVTGTNALTGTIGEGDPAQAHLVNNYDPAQADTTLTITGIKTVDDSYGAPYNWTNKSFRFVLEAYDPTTGAYTQQGQAQTITANGGRYTFGPLTFDTLGTYSYKVSEVIPDRNDREPFMSYDATIGHVEVQVTDNNVDGKLEITVLDAITGEALAASNNAVTFEKNFVNVYKEDYRPGYLEIPVQKEIEDTHNTGVTAAGFLFGMYKVEGGVTADTPTYTVRTTGADGVANFHIPFAGPLNETYVIKEIIPADADKIPGMDYDTTEYTVSISVVYDEDGVVTQYTIYKNGQPVNGDAAEFTNTMDLTPATQQFTVNKTVTGNPPTEDYTFTLTETDGSFATPKRGGVTDTVKINGSGSNVFHEITYNAVGTHYYVVKETPGSNPGITYDSAEYHITVNVVFANGGLVAETSITKLGAGTVQSMDFTNAYRITQFAKLTLEGTKILTGRELFSGEFQFGLYENGVLIESVKNVPNGKFTFSAITYTEPGTHTYTVKEIIPAEKLGGLTYSTEEYTISVTVDDNGKGGLNVRKTMGKENSSADEIVFTNVYKPTANSITLTGTKTWQDTNTNSALTVPADKFSFTLYSADENYNQGEAVKTVKNGANGAVSLEITYTKGGTHYYVFREDLGDDPTVSYDAGRYLIKDVVVDDGVGNLHIQRTITKDGVGDVAADKVDFGNLYTPAPAENVIAGTKTLTGRPHALEDGEFTFQLLQNGEVLQEVENVGGTFTFDAITYEKTGTYIYQVAEKLPDGHVNGVKNGITYDRTEYTYTVKVEDVNGQLTVTETSHTPEQLVFTNTYAGKGTQISVSGTKHFNKAMTGGEFTFELYKGSELVLSQTNGASTPGANNTHDAGFTFQIPLETAGEHTFTLKERNGGQKLNGIAYTDREYTIKVTVTDNGNGQLVAGTPVYYLGTQAVNEMEFVNTYTVEGTADAVIEGVKILQGGKPLEADMFTFQLYEGAQPTGTPIAETKNAADGTISFNLTYGVEDIGTHTYTVKEVAPEGYVKDGIRYTYLFYNVDIVVEDNGTGGLTVKAPVYRLGDDVEDKMEFVNVYTPDDTTMDLTIEKLMEVLSGDKKIGPEGFKFKITDEAGETVATVTSDENGYAAYTLTFTAEDIGKTYTYRITEVNTKKAGITYSSALYEVAVTVGQAQSGELTIACTVNGTAASQVKLTFRNTYEVPELPQTGDNMDFTMYVVMMGLSALGFVAMLILRKKEETAE